MARIAENCITVYTRTTGGTGNPDASGADRRTVQGPLRATARHTPKEQEVRIRTEPGAMPPHRNLYRMS